MTCFYHRTESWVVCVAGDFVGKHACEIIVQLQVRLLQRLASSHSPCNFAIAFSGLATRSRTPQHTPISSQMQSDDESRPTSSLKLNTIKPNWTSELDQAQSNAIKRSIGFNWSKFFVRVWLWLITKLNRTELRDCVQLSWIEFD